jgi:hypothetical protein
MPGPLDAVKKALQAYVDKDRDAIEAVIGDPYSFTSPLDNALSRETYFERCWPNSESCTGMKFVQGAEVVALTSTRNAAPITSFVRGFA